MTSIRMINAEETWPVDDPRASDHALPAGPANDPLPPIDASPILMRGTQSRRTRPDLDRPDGAPLDIDDLVQRVEAAADAAAQAWPGIWPTPPAPPDDRTSSTVNPLQAPAAQRDEVDALREIRRKQASALRQARDEIVGLHDSMKRLSAKLEQQQKETAAAQQAQQRAEKEAAALRAEREQANANFVELLQQTAELRAAFDQKDKEAAAMQVRIAGLKQELATKTASGGDLTAAITEAKARYFRDFDKRTAQFEAETEKLARALGAREERLCTLESENAQLSARCDALARAAADYEAANRTAQEQLESQTAKVAFLDATLQAERESTGQKIAALTGALQRERLARAGDAHAAAAVREGIMQLLPRLMREPTPASS